MKTFITFILIATIVSSDATLFDGWLNQSPPPQEHIHHHHHEVIYKSIGAGHPSAIVKVVHAPAEAYHQEHPQIYKILQGHQHGYGFEQGHNVAYGHAPAHVITKVVQPIVHKNFIHNQHEHHYHNVPSSFGYGHGPAHHGWN